MVNSVSRVHRAMFSPRPLKCCLYFLVMSSLIHGAVSVALAQEFYEADFRVDKLRYVNVTRIGAYRVHDILECIFPCLRNSLCLSLNLEASHGADGKYRCEMLNSDKYKYPAEFKASNNWHHIFIKNPCVASPSPCQNGGTCLPQNKYKTFVCNCKPGFIGPYCEKVVRSCQDLYEAKRTNVSKVETLITDLGPFSVLCQMGNFGCGEGGWTPVMKIDGSKQTFHYDSNYWSNKVDVNPDGGKVGFDSNESKLPTYWNTPFSRICLGMKIGEAMNFIVIEKQAESLHSMIADGLFRPTSLGRNAWKSLIGSQGSLQLKCNKEGFNAYNSISRARIGIIANNQNDCLTPDSRIGFGTGGSFGPSNTCGNAARLYADNGNINLMSMCYILVM